MSTLTAAEYERREKCESDFKLLPLKSHKYFMLEFHEKKYAHLISSLENAQYFLDHAAECVRMCLQVRAQESVHRRYRRVRSYFNVHEIL